MNCPVCGQVARYSEEKNMYFCPGCRKFMGAPEKRTAAPMGRRTVAFLVDSAVVGAATYALLLIIPAFSIGPLVNDVTVTLLLAAGAYFVSLHSAFGQTAGKRLMRVKVTYKGASPLPLEVSLLRYIAEALSVLMLGIGLIWAFFSREHRGWHDIVSETVVMEA